MVFFILSTSDVWPGLAYLRCVARRQLHVVELIVDSVGDNVRHDGQLLLTLASTPPTPRPHPPRVHPRTPLHPRPRVSPGLPTIPAACSTPHPGFRCMGYGRHHRQVRHAARPERSRRGTGIRAKECQSTSSVPDTALMSPPVRRLNSPVPSQTPLQRFQFVCHQKTATRRVPVEAQTLVAKNTPSRDRSDRVAASKRRH